MDFINRQRRQGVPPMEQVMKKLYINVTSRCNTDCPFCCMYSGTLKETTMSFNTFRDIVNKIEGDFILQLEGGEPLIHPQIFLFIAYAVLGGCKKIIIDTNGLNLIGKIDDLISLKLISKIPFEIKVSVNYWLLFVNEKHIEDIKDCVNRIENINDFNIFINTRKRFNDDWVDEKIKEFGLEKISRSFYLQAYGKLKGSNYGELKIKDNHEWEIFSADGTSFGKDLIARSEYERTLK